MKRNITSIIKTSDKNQTLINYLARRFRYHTREKWCEQIEAGQILLNGQNAEPSALLRMNDCVTYRPDEVEEPPVSVAYGILYEDEAILAVNKPGNLPCHPGGRYFNHTLWALLQNDGFGESLRFVHRLDRETSGVVLLAKTSGAAKNCQRQFLDNIVRKKYRVWVEGCFPGKWDAEGMLGPDPDSRIRKKQRFYPKEEVERHFKGKTCRTLFRRLAVKENLSLIEAVPKSGRLHQIRATLLSLGFPVVGDKMYGVDETIFLRFIKDAMTKEDVGRLRINRQALHASSLEMNHPGTGKRLLLEAPMPDDMKSPGTFVPGEALIAP